MTAGTKGRRAANRRAGSGLLARGCALGVLAALTFAATPALAEGSRSLYPSGYEAAHPDEGRANLDLTGTGTVYLNVVPRRTFIYVYAQAGEHLLLGSRNRTANNVGDISVYNPQSFGTKGYETIPGAADFTCSSGTTGLIDTRVKELAGPQSADLSGNLTGYVPCSYVAPSTGVYGVLFAVGSSGGNPDGVVDPPATSTNSASAWDVTVRSSLASSTTDINGRVFTYAWSSYTNGNGAGRRLYSDLYYVTDDGYRYRQSLKGIDPNAGTFFANALGFKDQGQPLYKDIRGTNQPVSAGIPAGVTADNAQYPIFFSDASSGGGTDVDTTLTALGIPLAPKPPQVNSFAFTYPPASGPTSYVGLGGTFSFHVTDTISYQIIISRDGIDWDPATPTNKVITGTSGTGDYSVTWDGKDNAGGNFPAGTGYQFRITGRNGEAHFPFVDVEGNLYGGPTLTKLNGNTIDSIVYYDDRGYVTRGGTAVGTLNGNLCGHAGWYEPTPLYSLLGVDSSDANLSGSGKYYRWWPDGSNNNSDCNNSTQAFGDTKALNLWTYQTTIPQSNTFNIIDYADVKATVSAPVSAAAGATVSVSVGFGNVGSQNANSTAYGISLPAGLSGVSCAGATCNYNSGTGAVTISGLPGSLSPAQWVNFTLSYTAPASGSVGLTATVTTSSNQGPNLAPDSAGASTLVGGTTTADVMTTVAPPPAAVAGGGVSVPVVYANVGGSSAAITAYTLSLPAGLSGVSCSGSGVSCTYNAGTGAVTLSGLPGTLTAGQNLPFTLNYTAPASGTVAVNSTIATSAAETNIANNTASGSTTVISGATPDVAATVAAPATATPGSTVNVPVSFGNIGGSTAASVSYALALPPGLSGVSCLGATCSYNSGTGTVTVSGLPATLAVGAWTSLTLSYTAPASGVIPLTATVTDGGDANHANDAATGSTTIITASTDADVVATVAPPATAAPGATVNVPVAFSNLGPLSATGVNYTLTLPSGLAGVSCGGSGVTCSYNSGTGAVTLSGVPGTLTAGQNLPFTLTYTAPASGSVQVDAVVSTSTPESNPANNSASGTTAIVSGASTADVTTTVAPPASATAGATVTVPVTFGNVGAITAAGVTYNLALTGSPAGIAVSYNSVACTYNSGTGAVTGCGLPASLTPGQSLSLVLTYTAPASGPVGVTSTVATSTAESNGTNNTANAQTSISAPDLSISLAGLPASGTVGVPYSGSYTCTNLGTADATAATTCTVGSGLPAGVTLGACTISPSSAAWVAGNTVPIGQTVTCTVSGTPSAAGSTTANGSTGATGDSNPANNTATRNINIAAATAPDLSISLAGLPASGTVGVPYSGSYTCTNLGTADATAATTCTVGSGLPAGVTLGACTISPSSAAWVAGNTVPVGQTVTCTVSGTPSAAGSTTANGSTGATGDGNPANNTATRNINIAAATAPDLSISLAGLPPSAQLGVPYSGSFTCSNIGTADATATTTCAVSGLPAGVTLGACTISPSSAAWVAGNTVPVGQTVTCTVSGTPSATGSTTVNGSTGATGDSNPANNTATLDIAVGANNSIPIPALSEWAMLLLSLMLGMAGLTAVRRR